MTITPIASHQLLQLLNAGEYLEIGLKGGGCGGATVTMERVVGMTSDALSIGEITNVIYADKITQTFLQGGVIDYEDQTFMSTFIFKPPLGTESCGCGASIRLDPKE